jgi:membrane fusion protein, multidrug efflux system
MLMRIGPIVTVALILGLGAIGGWWIKTPAGQANYEPTKKKLGVNGDAVPVTVAVAVRDTVPVHRQGIGTVQALNTVTVRSQVDGRLLSVDFVEGQMVKQGDVLARIDPAQVQAQYDQAVAKKAQDQATLANARMDLERYQGLVQTSAGSKQKADQQAALVGQLEALIKYDDAAIAHAQATLGFTTIVSPIDGRAGLRLVDPGNIARTGDANGLVTIVQVTPIAVVFTLPQRDLTLVSKALARGDVPVEIIDADGRTVLTCGQLQAIDNQIDIATSTIKLKATFANAGAALWPGQFVRTRAMVDVIHGATVVPTAAVRRGPAGTFVYLVDANLKAVVRPVSIAMQDSVRAIITEGIVPDDQVVTVGFAQLSDGKLVDVVESTSPIVQGSIVKSQRPSAAKNVNPGG